MRKLILLLGLVAIVACSPAESQDPVQATAAWDAPTYGTPVDHYVLQLQQEDELWVNLGQTEDTSFVVTLDYFLNYRVRVAGVDAEGRQGPYSLPSNWYNPSLTRPGVPGNVSLGE